MSSLFRSAAGLASGVPSIQRCLCAGLLCCAGVFATLHAHAASIAASTFDDIVADDGACSLREAITAVNTHAASGVRSGECVAGDGNDDTIVLAAGTYYLSIGGADEANNATGDLDLRASMTIAGSASGATTIDATLLSASGVSDRVMHIIGPSVQIVLEDMTITGGHAPDGHFEAVGESGGAILVENVSLTASHVHFLGNVAGRGGDAKTSTGPGGSGGDGGAISASNATLDISDSLFDFDHGGQAGSPGPAFSFGILGGGGSGGAISLRAGSTLMLARSTLSNNGAGTATVPFGSSPPMTFGGALFVSGNSVATVSQSVFDANAGDDYTFGIAIAVTGGSLAMTQSSVTRNSGLFSAVLAQNATLQLTNVTVAGNADVDSAIVLAQSASMSMDFVTVSGNHNGINSFGASGVYSYRNSIIAGNTLKDCQSNTAASFVSLGYSVVGTGCSSNATRDVVSTAPRLGPLTDNGGFGATMMPLPTSPAINAGSCAASSSSIDQRGRARPAAVVHVADAVDGCDIGALELDDDIFWDSYGG